MEILLALLGIGFALSFPVFYIWGAIACLRLVFGGRSTPQPRDNDLLVQLRAQAASAPETTLQAFLAERDSTPDAEPVPDDEKPKRQPGTRGNWYGDNAVNLLLFLGAFLVVAAVSLFVGFNWQAFGGPLRFALVVVFTLGWYAGGFIVANTLKLETPALAFITIGALLTPFCGVAWQLFVVGETADFGLTWLVTSLVSTGIYIGLGLAYRRRFFTYFGALSTLSMVLALVDIAEAPAEYFILTGTLTALLLLGVRLALRYLPKAYADFYAQDIEYASLGTLVASVALGLVAVAEGIPFYSVEVLAVLAVTVTYAWVYISLRLNSLTVATAQVLTVLLVDHALTTFGGNTWVRLFVGGGAHIALLAVLDAWLGRRQDKTLLHMVNGVALALTGVFYFSSMLTDSLLLPLVFALALTAHAVYVGARFQQAWLYRLAGGGVSLTAAHLLALLDAPSTVYPVVLALVNAGLFGLGYSAALPENARVPLRQSALGVLALVSVFVFGVASLDSDAALHIAGWAAGYTLLALLWIERGAYSDRLRDYLVCGAALSQYVWHIFYLEAHWNSALFSDIQWYTAATGAVLLFLAWRELSRGVALSLVTLLEGLAAAALLLPTLGQIVSDGRLLWFVLGMAYALGLAAYGVTFERRLMRQLGTIGVVAVVLFQTRDFFFVILPRWLVIGLVGFGLLVAGVALALRQRQQTQKGG